MCWVIDHYLDGGGIVVKLLGSDAAVIVVKVFEGGWDEQYDLSCDGVAKVGKIFGVDGFNYFLDEGSLKNKSF